MLISIPSQNAADERDIAALESQLGYRLSPHFKSFLKTHNGAIPENNIFDVGLENHCGISRFIPVAQILTERDLIGDLPSGAYPVAFAECGNWIIIDESEQGAVYFWDHEIEGGQTRLAANFEEFLNLLKPFDPATVELKSQQVERVWIDPEFLKNLKDHE